MTLNEIRSTLKLDNDIQHLLTLPPGHADLGTKVIVVSDAAMVKLARAVIPGMVSSIAELRKALLKTIDLTNDHNRSLGNKIQRRYETLIEKTAWLRDG